MASMIPAVPIGLLMMRKFQYARQRLSSQQRDKSVHVTPSCLFALLPWRGKGAPLGLVLSHVLVTMDASTWGWGGICRDAHANGTRSDEERPWHINLLELYDVFLSVTHFYDMGLLSGHHGLVCSDNTYIIAHINKQEGTSSLPLLSLSHRIL